MQSLSTGARAFLGGCYLLGAAALGLMVAGGAPPAVSSTWILAGCLLLLIAAARLFPVARDGEFDAQYLSGAPIFAAFLLLPPALLGPTLALAFIPAIYQARRSVAIPLVHLCSWLIGLGIADTLVRPATVPIERATIDVALAALVVLAVRLVVLVAVQVVVAGAAPREMAMLTPTSALREAALLSIGWVGAVAFHTEPLYGAMAALPLVLIYHSLRASTLARPAADGRAAVLEREQFEAALGQAISRAERAGASISVLRCEASGLPTAAAAGADVVAAATARIAESMALGLRSGDAVTRIGGEVVAMLLGSDVEGALLVANRLRRRVESARLDDLLGAGHGPIALLVGVAAYPHDGWSAGDLMREADLALFQARLTGQEQLVVAGQSSRETASRWAQQMLEVAPALDKPVGASVPAPSASPAPGVATAAAPTPASATAPTPARPAGPSPVVAAYIGLLFVGSIAGLFVGPGADFSLGAQPWAAIAMFVLLTLFAERVAPDLLGRSRTSVTIAPVFGATLVAGALGGLATALTFATSAKIKARSPLHRAAFNFVMVLMCTHAVRWTFGLLVPEPLGAVRFELMILPAILAGMAYYVVNHLLVSIVRGLSERRRVWEIWYADYRWLAPHFAVLGVLGLALAMAHEVMGLAGALTFVAPVAMMQLAIRQYMERTTANVRQLWTLNEQLKEEIDQRIAAEQENARLAEEAARAGALEELSRLKSEFISIASHELRTPMTAIMGYSELLLDDATPPEMRRRWTTFINKGAQELTALIDDLLDVSRIESGRMKVEMAPVDLQILVDSIMDAARATAPNHALSAEIAPDARWVQADPDKLRQVMTNLISNAVKYSPKGGPVTVAARRDDGGRIAIAVADRGLGIPLEHQGRIFERFQRVDVAETRGIRGTGLGLYIVKNLVELLGGSVHLESEPGRGSTFHVSLRVAQPTSEQPARGRTNVFGSPRAP